MAPIPCLLAVPPPPPRSSPLRKNTAQLYATLGKIQLKLYVRPLPNVTEGESIGWWVMYIANIRLCRRKWITVNMKNMNEECLRHLLVYTHLWGGFYDRIHGKPIACDLLLHPYAMSPLQQKSISKQSQGEVCLFWSFRIASLQMSSSVLSVKKNLKCKLIHMNLHV